MSIPSPTPGAHDGACGNHRENKLTYFGFETQKVRDHLGEEGMDGKILLKVILEKCDMRL
jgi:hypothetical protein